MKLDTINIMPGSTNINKGSKNDTTKSSLEFINIFEQSSKEELMKYNLQNNDDDKELEELIMILAEMMIKKSEAPLDLESFADKVEDDKEKILNLNKANLSEIFNRLNVDEYFLGNKENANEIISILNSFQKENGIDEVNQLLDKVKNKLVESETSTFKDNLTFETYSDDYMFESRLETVSDNKFANIENYENLELNIDSKENNTISNRENMNHQKDKDISILKEIAKEDSSNFLVNENKYRIDNNLDISSSKDNALVEVRASKFTQDVVESIHYLKNNNLQELKVNLNPKELGEITIKLIKSDKETKLSVVVAKDEVYSLVNKNLQEIAKHLEDLDIKINEISVDIKNDNQSSFSDNLNHQFKDQQGKKKNHYQNNGDVIESEDAKLTNEENINLLA